MPSPAPDWVKALKPAGPQGSELLQKERAQSNVNVERLSELLHTKETLERQRSMLALLQPEKVFDKSQNHTLGRVERLQRSLGKAKRLQQLAEQHKWSMEELHAANDLIGEPTPYGLHASMFLVSESTSARMTSLTRWCPKGDSPGTRDPRAAQAVPRTRPEIRNNRLLRPDRARSRIECAWLRDHCNLELKRQDIHH